ncbi:MAG: histidine phosphatase family protein [Kiloniellales bacterium]
MNKPQGTTTRWWWIRHAPVINHGGRIYGQDDPDCDCSHTATTSALAGLLPAGAVWLTSHLSRTQLTAQAIIAHLPDGTAPVPRAEPELAEQHFGAWQGLTNEELEARRDGDWHRFWLAPATEAPPGGESFADVVERVSATVQRLSAEHAGRDIVAISHGGTIRAALALALGIDAERALAFAIDNYALTRLDHITGAPGSHAPQVDGVWRVCQVNHAPTRRD